MTEEEIRRGVLDTLAGIAPETAGESIRPDVNLRDQLDLDSMDFLNFAIGLHERFGIEIPEADYPHFSTLVRSIAYIKRKLPPDALGGVSPESGI